MAVLIEFNGFTAFFDKVQTSVCRCLEGDCRTDLRRPRTLKLRVFAHFMGPQNPGRGLKGDATPRSEQQQLLDHVRVKPLTQRILSHTCNESQRRWHNRCKYISHIYKFNLAFSLDLRATSYSSTLLFFHPSVSPCVSPSTFLTLEREGFISGSLK